MKLSPTESEEFSLRDAVFLISLIRTGGSEDLRSISPLNTMVDPLGPQADYSIDMLRHLSDRGIIQPHPASSPSAFEWEGEQLAGYDLGKVHWGIPVGGRQLPFGDLQEVLESKLRKGPEEWPESWQAELPVLWREIILSEALRYLIYCLKDHHFDFTPGDKTRLVLRSALEEFSLAQMWNQIWKCSKDAAAYYQRGGVGRAQAANSVVTRIQGYGEYAKANGWEIRPSRRERNIPIPMVVSVLFSTGLSIGHTYQEQIPPPLLPEGK